MFSSFLNGNRIQHKNSTKLNCQLISAAFVAHPRFCIYQLIATRIIFIFLIDRIAVSGGVEFDFSKDLCSVLNDSYSNFKLLSLHENSFRAQCIRYEQQKKKMNYLFSRDVSCHSDQTHRFQVNRFQVGGKNAEENEQKPKLIISLCVQMWFP